MQLQVEKPQKSRNNVFRKKQTRCHVRYLEVSKFEKMCAWFSWSQRTKPKVNETFSAVKTNNKVCLVYSQSKLQQDIYSWCIYLLKCLKSKEKTHLEARKQQTRFRLKYLDVWRMEKWYGWCFEVQIVASKIDGTFSEVRNKEQGYLGVFRV